MAFVALSPLLNAQCAACGRKSVTLCECPCRKAYYCDVGCQRQHWTEHKTVCTKAQRHVTTKLNRCASCGSLSNVLKICGCGTAYYCSIECQRKHYGVHRRICTVASSRAPASASASAGLTGTMLAGFDGGNGDQGGASVAVQTDETCHELLEKLQAERKAASPKKRRPQSATSAAPSAMASRVGSRAASRSENVNDTSNVSVASAVAAAGEAQPAPPAQQQQDDDDDVEEGVAIPMGRQQAKQQQQQEEEAEGSPEHSASAADAVAVQQNRGDDGPTVKMTGRVNSFVMPKDGEESSPTAVLPPSAESDANNE